MTDHKLVNGIKIPLSSAEKEEMKQKALEHNIKLQELKKVEYKHKREKEYPPIEDLIVALWEHIVEGDPTEKDLLQAKRLLVKHKYLKPKEL